jgi:hypothetical protein
VPRAALINNIFGQAIRSFQKYPAPLYSGEQAMVLDGVGKFIAKKLADKFEEYRHKHPEATFEPDPHGRQPFVPVTPAKKGAKRSTYNSTLYVVWGYHV